MLRMASAHEVLGETDAARALYSHAQTIDPNNSFLYTRIGMFHRNRNETAKAEEAFQKSQKLNWWANETATVNLEELMPRR
jgi:Flp pilus assembly protein TadD